MIKIPKSKNIAALDFDGTLIDSVRTYYSIFHPLALEYLGNDFSFDEFFDMIGMKYRDALLPFAKNMVDDPNHAHAHLDEMHVHYHRIATERIPKSPLFTDTVPFLERLKQNNFTVALISSANHEVVEEALQVCGIENYFDFVCGRTEETLGDKKIQLQLFAKFMGWEMSEFKKGIFIDDSPHCIEVVQSTHIYSIGIAREKNRTEHVEKLKGAGADVVIHSLDEIQLS